MFVAKNTSSLHATIYGKKEGGVQVKQHHEEVFCKTSLSETFHQNP